jgi:hypothetical protein
MQDLAMFQWFATKYSDGQVQSIYDDGADAGFFGITYTYELLKLYDEFEFDIWNLVDYHMYDNGLSFGEVINSVDHYSTINSPETFKTRMVWLAISIIAKFVIEHEEITA